MECLRGQRLPLWKFQVSSIHSTSLNISFPKKFQIHQEGGSTSGKRQVHRTVPIWMFSRLRTPHFTLSHSHPVSYSTIRNATSDGKAQETVVFYTGREYLQEQAGTLLIHSRHPGANSGLCGRGPRTARDQQTCNTSSSYQPCIYKFAASSNSQCHARYIVKRPGWGERNRLARARRQ